MEDKLEDIVHDSKSNWDKFKDGFSAIYPIAGLSLVSSFVSFSFCEPIGIEQNVDLSFDLTTNLSNGSSFFFGFSENKYKKISSLSILAGAYVPQLVELITSDYPYAVQQELSVKVVGTILCYGVGALLKK